MSGGGVQALEVIGEDEVLSAFYDPDGGTAQTLEEYSRARVLWICVLRQAIYDFVKTRKATRLKGRVLHQEVSKWLFSDTPTHFNSYLNICEVFELDAKRWRQEALRMTLGHMKRIEILGRRKPARGRVHPDEAEERH